MKSTWQEVSGETETVAPYTGAWIERKGGFIMSQSTTVAPYTGAWIESGYTLPNGDYITPVAPYTGAWIES